MEIAFSPLEFARRARKLYGHREAVVDGSSRFTYSQFLERCDRWSAALQKLGVGQGDRVALVAPNTHAMLEQFYAVPQMGAITVPLNYRLRPDDFAYMIEHSGSRVVCAHADYLDAIDSIRDRLSNVEYFVALEGARPGWLDYECELAAAPQEFVRPAIAEGDLISINYTSGTTSRPKGVMITHRNAWTNAVGALVHYPMTQADRYLWTLPMFHANGWGFVWIVTAVGGAHVCLRKVDSPSIHAHVERESISMLCAAPTVLISIANETTEQRTSKRSSVRVLTAGAPPAAATIELMEGALGWEITQVYGLTETAPFISFCEPRPEDECLVARDRANLKARQGVEMITSGELRVVDEADVDVPQDGQSLGEIVARGNVVMKGYYNDPRATEAAFRGGWFRTGDAAVVHPDGYIEIRDRYKDVIISGGENISSIEIEGALLRHPAVLEVAVVGIPHEKWGEAPKAFIVLRAGSSATEPELREFCRTNLAHFKVPQRFDFVTELPKTATGKIQKFALRDRESAINRQ